MTRQKGQHGEPWAWGPPPNHGCAIVDRDGKVMLENWGADADHAIACVNALDGLEPEGVSKAVEILRDLALSHDEDLCALMYPDRFSAFVDCKCQARRAAEALDALGLDPGPITINGGEDQ